MNTKSILLAGAMSLGLVGLAQATSVVYMTGSTAGRGAIYDTVTDGTNVFDAAPTIVYQGATSARSAGYVNFSNTVNGVATVLKCHWSGSEGGIADIAGSGTEAFLDDGAASDTNSTAPGPFVSSSVQLAAADNDKAYSKNPTAAITGNKVAVIPFKWEKEKGSSANLVNVTDAAIRNALKGGNAKLALFTGNSADTTRVFVSGRDNNSGTRVNAYGDTGFGIFSTPKQITLNANGSLLSFGNVGYSSGGDLAKQLGYDLTQATSVDTAPGGDGTSHFSVIGYVGMSDASTAEGNGASALSYDGVPFSIAAILEGQYGFWGNYYVYGKNSGLSTEASSILSSLEANVSSHADDTTLIKLTSMHATRNGPTSDPTHN